MARRSSNSFIKRQKEIAKKEKRQQKLARRQERRKNRELGIDEGGPEIGVNVLAAEAAGIELDEAEDSDEEGDEDEEEDEERSPLPAGSQSIR